MHVTIPSLAAALSGAVLTSAVPLEARQDTLLPFELTWAVSSNPPVGSGVDPWNHIYVNFTDPNSYPFFVGEHDGTIPGGLQGTNCVAEWYRDESPEGRTWPCDLVSPSHFALQVLPGTGASATLQDFKLKLIHGIEPGSSFSKVRGRVEAVAGPFVYGDNLKGDSQKGPCLKSGWCTYHVSTTPLQVPATKTV